MPRRTREEAEQTFHALLEAAADLFISQGVGTTTLSDIAKKAGVTRGAIYWHFKGKEDVILALWDNYADPQVRQFEDHFRHISPADAPGEFRQVVEKLVDSILDDKRVGQAIRIVLHNIELTDQGSPVQDYFQERRAAMRDAMQAAFNAFVAGNWLHPEFDSLTCANGFMCLFHGMLDQHFTTREPIDMCQNGKAVTEIFLRGVMR